VFESDASFEPVAPLREAVADADLDTVRVALRDALRVKLALRAGVRLRDREVDSAAEPVLVGGDRDVVRERVEVSETVPDREVEADAVGLLDGVRVVDREADALRVARLVAVSPESVLDTVPVAVSRAVVERVRDDVLERVDEAEVLVSDVELRLAERVVELERVATSEGEGEKDSVPPERVRDVVTVCDVVTVGSHDPVSVTLVEADRVWEGVRLGEDDTERDELRLRIELHDLDVVTVASSLPVARDSVLDSVVERDCDSVDDRLRVNERDVDGLCDQVDEYDALAAAVSERVGPERESERRALGDADHVC